MSIVSSICETCTICYTPVRVTRRYTLLGQTGPAALNSIAMTCLKCFHRLQVSLMSISCRAVGQMTAGELQWARLLRRSNNRTQSRRRLRDHGGDDVTTAWSVSGTSRPDHGRHRCSCCRRQRWRWRDVDAADTARPTSGATRVVIVCGHGGTVVVIILLVIYVVVLVEGRIEVISCIEFFPLHSFVARKCRRSNGLMRTATSSTGSWWICRLFGHRCCRQNEVHTAGGRIR